MKKLVRIFDVSSLVSSLLLSVLLCVWIIGWLTGSGISAFLLVFIQWPLTIVLLVLWLLECVYLWRSRQVPTEETRSRKRTLPEIVRLVWRGILWLKACLVGAIVVWLFMVVYPPRYDGPYRGQVVDADTGTPIADAVVLGEWNRVYANVAGGASRYYDAREVLTDAHGDFVMPGQGLLLLSNIRPGHMVIFKAGYEYVAFHMLAWDDIREGRSRRNIHWDGEKAMILSKKLTLEERKKRLIGLAGSFSQKKQKLLIRELNKERVELGRRDLYEEPK
jgi:hypothetical protein